MHRKQLSNLSFEKDGWGEIIDIINDAITIHDNDFNIIKANKAAQELLGISLDNITCNKCFESYHGTLHPPGRCPSCKTLQSGEPSTTEVYEPHLKKHLEVKALPIFDGSRQIIGVVHVVKDISRRKLAEEKQKQLQARMLQSQRMEAVGTLASGIAHDFNNILGAIIGCAELSLLDISDKDRLDRHLQEILNAAYRGRELIKQIVSLGRKQEIERKTINLEVLVKESVKLLRSVLPKTISIKQRIGFGIGKVFADTTQIHQVLLTLTSNAAQAKSDAKGVLTIALENAELDNDQLFGDNNLQSGPFVKLTISDVADDDSEQANSQLFEASIKTKDKKKGSFGLELAIINTIIRNHEGVFLLENEFGVGTTFHIYLPMHERRKEVRLHEKKNPPTGTESILFVDDEQVILESLSQILIRFGYKVESTLDSEKALNIFEKNPDKFDVLITDLTMPKMTGIELAEKIINMKPDVKIILATGYGEFVHDHDLKKIGIKKILKKPLEVYDLALAIREVLA